jgi:hypothetical protein
MHACTPRYGLQDECRVLLVHGLLHLLGFDHEAGAAEAAAMAAAEQRLLRTLGWQVGRQLIASLRTAGPILGMHVSCTPHGICVVIKMRCCIVCLPRDRVRA